MTRRSSADFDAALCDALRPMAAAAPLPADLLDVPDRWVRRDRRGSEPARESAGPRPLAVALVIGCAVVVVLLATSILGGMLQAPRVGDPDDEVSLPLRALDLDPTVIRNPSLIGMNPIDATGPVIQLAHGNAAESQFRLVAYRSAQGYCLGFAWQGGSGDGCGALPQDDAAGGAAFGFTLAHLDPAVPGYLAGMVAPDAVAVRAESARGGHAVALMFDLDEAGIDARAFLVFLPVGFDADSVVAYGADGGQVGRFIVDEGAPPGAGDPGVDPSREPRMYAILRNHTEQPIDLAVEDRTADSEGSTSGPIPACDVDAAGIGIFEGKTWWVEVDGREIFHSDQGLPSVRSGEVLELVIDVREGREPMITEFVVLPVERSAGGEPAGRGPRIGWTERLWSLAADLECEFDPESF
jgi:hypothetical protein